MKGKENEKWKKKKKNTAGQWYRKLSDNRQTVRNGELERGKKYVLG